MISQLRTETTSAPINAAVNVVTENPLITPEPRYQKIAPLIKREKNPSVSTLSGSVRRLMIGRRNILISVRHAPTIRTIHTGSIRIPSLITNVVAQIAIDNASQCKSILIPLEAGRGRYKRSAFCIIKNKFYYKIPVSLKP